jgi:hypothetical protein
MKLASLQRRHCSRRRGNGATAESCDFVGDFADALVMSSSSLPCVYCLSKSPFSPNHPQQRGCLAPARCAEAAKRGDSEPVAAILSAAPRCRSERSCIPISFSNAGTIPKRAAAPLYSPGVIRPQAQSDSGAPAMCGCHSSESSESRSCDRRRRSVATLSLLHRRRPSLPVRPSHPNSTSFAAPPPTHP